MQQSVPRAHTERTAWIVVWGAFISLCLLVILVPLTARHFLLYSTLSHPARLRTLEGTALVDNQATGSTRGVTRDKTADVTEGCEITLDDNSRAELTFFDGSSIVILPGSRLSLERMRGPRFSQGITPVTLWLRLNGVSGRVMVVTSGASRPTGLDFVLRCPFLNADMSVTDDGIYGVEMEANGADIFANRGSAIVTANGKDVNLAASERTRVEPGSGPTSARNDGLELLVNGDFRAPLEQGWTVSNDQGQDGESVSGQAVLTVDEGTPAVRFYRTGSENNHCETIIEQKINRDLPEPSSALKLSVHFKLINQSLPGGGDSGTEFPLMIRLKYRDAYGSENEWVQGFYYGDPRGKPVGTGQQYPQDTWQLFPKSGDLNLLATLNPKPVHIISLRVYASGWNYESMVRWISLRAQ